MPREERLHALWSHSKEGRCGAHKARAIYCDRDVVIEFPERGEVERGYLQIKANVAPCA